MKLPVPLSFDWNKGNIDKNWQKHKVHYKEAEEAFLNKPLSLLRDKKHSQSEERYIALGMTSQKRKLHIVFTIRNSNIRIISARNQSKKERKYYAKE
ncbi:MAG: hypothetical protein UT24_C0007G0066 [Candidatus Woesebacteria bacterium GW2011_GWB1_39_12]|uniref:Protein containing DUF497 n=2 Tax=Candidatus Woeseibacteriota TaxID=1752722 RepID=A0A0G0PJP5_9BACT|nr:MAG: hypothetical protein UT23_C0004G0145 [Candidatus Woesebacteria bacterium GW2011_GWA1_39_12]KKR01102.1 MAG: hypothetical protein UT24_C0007G0066 [Candidatus Woesebacteria bacterium GW2011_GWB1_39_12]